MKIKVLYISYDGLTDPLGQSQVLPYLVELNKLGHSIDILSVEKKENFQKREHIIREIVQQADITWHFISYTKKPPVISTIYDVRRLKKKANDLYQKNQYNLVHCRSYIASLVGLYLKQKYPVKFIFDMRGFWADERVDGGLWNLRNPVFKSVYQYFKKKEKEFLRNADYTISLTHNAKEEIENWKLPNSSSIEVIPCCVDTNLFTSPERVPQTSDTPFTISYLGSIGTWYMLEEMLQFFKRLLHSKPEAKFLFITTENPSFILEGAQNLGIPSSHFIIQKAERKEVPVLLSQSDISIFFIKPLYSKKASSATKMGEILAMGIPMIANKNVGDHHFLFEKYTCGVSIDLKSELEKDLQEYDKAIREIDHLLKIPKETLREVALDYFSLEKGVKLYHSVYQCVLEK